MSYRGTHQGPRVPVKPLTDWLDLRPRVLAENDLHILCRSRKVGHIDAFIADRILVYLGHPEMFSILYESKLCAVCGKALQPPKRPRSPRKTCSNACAIELTRRSNLSYVGKTKPRVIRDCEWCGEPMGLKSRPDRQVTARFCSLLCSRRAKTSGGLHVGGDGRWRVTMRTGGARFYSRCLMEAKLGRLLTFNEVVHHINGDPTDDRLENLMVMSRAEHTGMHSTEYWAQRRSERGAAA